VDAGDTLIALARAAIGARWGAPQVPHDAQWLQEPGASFVTVTLHGDLRGCIGTLEAYRPLREDVAANAVAAAFHDRRFRPLEFREFDRIRIEVSVLSAVEPLASASEEEALGLLRPGVDGVLFECAHGRGTFLPQMWERFRDPRVFLGHLKLKIGLRADYWDASARLSRYTVTAWHEREPGAAPD
jgi:AmmeMemoRadiSam system protein A